MSRILLADDSPHAQRMGERLLRDEGHEVITLVDGEQVLARLGDIDPDFLILDAALPLRSGYEICRFVKDSAFYRHAAVFLTGSLAAPVDSAQASACGSDGLIQKPFETRALTSLIQPLLAVVAERREHRPAGPPPPAPGKEPRFASGRAEAAPVPGPAPGTGVSEQERIRAAVLQALDAMKPKIADEVTRQILRAMNSK